MKNSDRTFKEFFLLLILMSFNFINIYFPHFHKLDVLIIFKIMYLKFLCIIFFFKKKNY